MTYSQCLVSYPVLGQNNENSRDHRGSSAECSYSHLTHPTAKKHGTDQKVYLRRNISRLLGSSGLLAGKPFLIPRWLVCWLFGNQLQAYIGNACLLVFAYHELTLHLLPSQASGHMEEMLFLLCHSGVVPGGKIDHVCVICNNVFVCNHFCITVSVLKVMGSSPFPTDVLWARDAGRSGQERGGNRIWGLLAGAQGRSQEQHPRNVPLDQPTCWLRIWGWWCSNEGTPHGTLGSHINTSAPIKVGGIVCLSFCLSRRPFRLCCHTDETTHYGSQVASQTPGPMAWGFWGLVSSRQHCLKLWHLG